MGINVLIIPTLSDYTDVFRPAVSKPGSKAFLFNPKDSRYRLEGNSLKRDGRILSQEELLRLASDSNVNQSIEENVLIYGVFSYLYLKGLRFHGSFEIGITDISRYFGVTMGEKGFRLLDKLRSLEAVYGVFADSGEVHPLLTVELHGSKLRLTSTYMHRALAAMLAVHQDWMNRKSFFYSGMAHASLIAARNKTAALIVIELVRLIASAGVGRTPRISIFRLEQYVSQLRAVRLSAGSTSQKNRDLKRIFRAAYRLLQSETDIFVMYRDFVMEEVVPTVNDFQMLIKASHSGFANNEEWGQK